MDAALCLTVNGINKDPDRTPRRRRGIYLLPKLLTTGGLFAGFYSIIAAIDGNFVAAAIAMFVAMALDGADGRVARMTSTSSEFGKEFDNPTEFIERSRTPTRRPHST